jgi:hypothetical protein
MTAADLAEIKRLLAAYRAARQPHTGPARARLETALVRHVDALIKAAELALIRRQIPGQDPRAVPIRIIDQAEPTP